jgi:hypothetical protein
MMKAAGKKDVCPTEVQRFYLDHPMPRTHAMLEWLFLASTDDLLTFEKVVLGGQG